MFKTNQEHRSVVGQASIELRLVPVDVYAARTGVGDANFEISFPAEPLQSTLVAL